MRLYNFENKHPIELLYEIVQIMIIDHMILTIFIYHFNICNLEYIVDTESSSIQ